MKYTAKIDFPVSLSFLPGLSLCLLERAGLEREAPCTAVGTGWETELDRRRPQVCRVRGSAPGKLSSLAGWPSVHPSSQQAVPLLLEERARVKVLSRVSGTPAAAGVCCWSQAAGLLSSAVTDSGPHQLHEHCR